MHEGGVYANGQVVIQPLPAALYCDDAQRTIPLRRWEAVLTAEELEEQCAKEMQKVYTPLACMRSPLLVAPYIAHCATTYAVTVFCDIYKITLNLFVRLVHPLAWSYSRYYMGER